MSEPKVAVDGRTLQQSPLGGVGRMLAGVLPRLAGRFAVDLLLDERRPQPQGTGGVPLVPHRLRGPLSASATAWLQLAVPLWLHRYPGVFHCPFYGLPYRQPVPMVVSIYDLTFETNPEWFSRRRLVAFRAQARHAALTARVVLTSSEVVAGQLTDRLGVPAGRVRLARPAADACFFAAGARRAELTGAGRPYLVAMGGAPRRRLAAAVQAWRQARRLGADVDLVVVGPEPPGGGAETPGLSHAGPVDDAALAELLAGAVAFVYPTAYEGFGLPALEAAAAGCPVICAPVGALPEVLGVDAEWCEAPEPGPLADGIVRLSGDGARAEGLSRRARQRAEASPGWDEAADRVADAYAAAAAGE